jgi:hypothetical protein
MSFSTGVSADDSGVEVPPSEPQKGSEYVKKKIKNSKNRKSQYERRASNP